MDDHQIKTAITRLKNGEIKGLAVLVQRYQTQAIRTAFLITQDRALAEDVVQAAFLRVYQRIEQFDTRRPFGPWFMRIAANAAVQAAQRNLRQVSLDAPVSLDGELTYADVLPMLALDPAGEAEAAELRQQVWEALGRLSPEQRAAIVMRYYLDLSESEMAAQLETPAGTIKWRLHAARKRLRALLHRPSADLHKLQEVSKT